MVELSNHHFPVPSLVVQLEALHVVIDVPNVLVLLHLRKDGKELINFQLLLA